MERLKKDMHDNCPRRILVIGPFPPPYGGWAHVTLSLYKALLADGFRVTAYNTNLHSENDARKRRLAMLWRASKQILSLPSVLAARQPDTVILLTGPGGSLWRDLLLIHVLKSKNMPFLIRAFGGQLFTYTARFPSPLQSFILRTWRSTKAMLVETEEMASQWRKVTSAIPVYRVPNFVLMENIPAKPPTKKQFQAVYMGNITPLKGVETILASIDRVCDEYPSTIVHFIGGEITIGYLNQFRAMADKLRHSGAIRIYGALPHEKALEVLNQCQVFLFPTQWPGEGQPAALIEAMSIGLVPIATSWRGVSEIVEHEVNGLLLNPLDSDQVEEALLRLFRDKEFYQRLARNAELTIHENYEARGAVERFREILKTVSE